MHLHDHERALRWPFIEEVIRLVALRQRQYLDQAGSGAEERPAIFWLAVPRFDDGQIQTISIKGDRHVIQGREVCKPKLSTRHYMLH
jgi:hypothetical protein